MKNNETIQLNKLNEECYQILGKLNGFAQSRVIDNRTSWEYSVSALINGHLIKISTNPKNCTIWNLDILLNKLNLLYIELLEEYTHE